LFPKPLLETFDGIFNARFLKNKQTAEQNTQKNVKKRKNIVTSMLFIDYQRYNTTYSSDELVCQTTRL